MEFWSTISLFAFGLTLVVIMLTLLHRVYRDLLTVKSPPPELARFPRYGAVSPWEQRNVDQETDFAYQVLDIRKQLPSSPIVLVRRYGIPVLYVFDLDSIKVIMNDTATFGRNRHEYDLMKSVIGDGLITQEGAIHRLHRHFVDPAFKYSSLKAVLPLFSSTTDEFVQMWKDSIAAGGGTVQADIYMSFLKLTLDIIGKAAFGIDFDSLSEDATSPGAQAAAALIDLQASAMPPTVAMLLAAYPSIFGKLASLPIGPGAKRAQGLLVMDNLVYGVIAAKRKSIEEGVTRGDGVRDMLDLLLEETGPDKLTDRQILEHVKTVLFAGHHTTTSLLTFLFLCLADQPTVLARVRKEIKDVIGNSLDIANAHVNKLPYLTAIIRETLRMYSPVAKVARSVDCDTELMGEFLPAGTNVDVCMSAIHMDPAYWPEPEKFDPERWMPGSATPANIKAYMPFIHGPRNCIGSKFFMMEAKVILCKILPQFDFNMPQEQLKATKRALHFTIKPDPKPVMTLSIAAM